LDRTGRQIVDHSSNTPKSLRLFGLVVTQQGLGLLLQDINVGVEREVTRHTSPSSK
jgi:hypothetical protein